MHSPRAAHRIGHGVRLAADTTTDPAVSYASGRSPSTSSFAPMATRRELVETTIRPADAVSG